MTTMRRFMRKYPTTTLWLVVITTLEVVLIVQNLFEHH